MLQRFRAVLREPLLHFLLAGAGLFLLYSFATDSPDVADDEIVVTSGHIEHLTTIFVKTWQRPPMREELNGLIDNYILEEVLYREAVAIGLDKDDTIIRRRLKQKMDFLVDDFSAAEPSDDELQKFLDDNPDRFQIEASVSFEHVYFIDADVPIDVALVSLQDNGSLDDRIMSSAGLLPRRFDEASETTIANQFGPAFKDALFAQEIGRWTGPLQSPFGRHLVYIDGITQGRMASLEEVRDAVEREWLVDRREVAQQTFFDSLRSKYRITIEDPALHGS